MQNSNTPRAAPHPAFVTPIASSPITASAAPTTSTFILLLLFLCEVDFGRDYIGTNVHFINIYLSFNVNFDFKGMFIRHPKIRQERRDNSNDGSNTFRNRCGM